MDLAVVLPPGPVGGSMVNPRGILPVCVPLEPPNDCGGGLRPV